MKTDIHFWSYLAHFLVHWNTFRTIFVEKIKIYFVFSYFFFFRKSCRLWDNVEKFCTAGQATNDIMHMRIACWIPKAIDTHTEYVIFVDFSQRQWLCLSCKSVYVNSASKMLLLYRCEIWSLKVNTRRKLSVCVDVDIEGNVSGYEGGSTGTGKYQQLRTEKLCYLYNLLNIDNLIT